MPFENELIDAYPVDDYPDKLIARSWGRTRNAYCLSTSEDSRDYVAVDAEGGGVTPALIQNGRLYALDDADTTTAHDGVLCLVSYDNKRYKIDGLSLPYSVLDKDLTAPLDSPAPVIGDAHLIFGSGTDDWAGHSGEITILTSRGWEFADPPIGFKVYIEDEDAFYYKDANGDWRPGLGAVVVPDASVPLSALMWDGRVENQTTDNPPSSWLKGTAYIIRTPSGGNHWSGNTLKLAIAESDGVLADGDEFTIYDPWLGLRAFDKALGITFEWNGEEWVSASGVWTKIKDSGLTLSGSTTYVQSGTSGVYEYSSSAAPTTSHPRLTDNVIVSHKANAAGAKLRVCYCCDIPTWSSSGNIGQVVNADSANLSIALFRDGESNAVDWRLIGIGLGGGVYTDPHAINVEFIVAAPDADEHDYKIAFMAAVIQNGTTDIPHYPASLTRRRLMIEETT